MPKPTSWPPELNDEDSFNHFFNVLKTLLDADTWNAYYAIGITSGRKLVGSGGFVFPPNEEGMLEIGYSILPEDGRKGIASRLTGFLVNKAFPDERITYVYTTTYPHLVGAIGVLEKNGFKYDGDRDEGIIAYKRYR